MAGQPTEKNAKTGVNLDELQQEAEKLVALLKDRQSGLMSWNMLMKERVESIHNMTGEVLGKA